MQGDAICIFGFDVVNASLLYYLEVMRRGFNAWRVSAAAHNLTLITSVWYVSFTSVKRTSNNRSNSQVDS